MIILDANQTKRAEQLCFDEYSTEAELMLKAGTLCFDEIFCRFGDDMKFKKTAVFCGNGKNAGDGFVIARLLYSKGIDVEIVLCDKKPCITEPRIYFEYAVSSGVPVVMYSGEYSKYDYIVDCIFGIGFHGAPKPPFDKVFSDLSKSEAKIISVDTPSGTDSTTGEACKNCVKADLTIAISTLKYCHILPPSNGFCGEVITIDIGIPDSCYVEEYSNTIDFTSVKSSLIKQDINADKGSNGKLLCICGSYTMPGAAVFCVESAIRCGVGLVNLITPKSAYPLISAHTVQPVFSPVDEENGIISSNSIEKILTVLNQCDAVVIGCGMGVNENTERIVKEIVNNSTVPVIIDADGINSLVSSIDILKDTKAPVVLTPHPGEMSRLISKTVSEVQTNRIALAKCFAEKYGVVLVLKGANTVVTDGDKVFVNTTGNPSLAMGGTGDMLAGMIGSFAAQGMLPIDSANAGVFIHGYNADFAAMQKSQRGLTVFDLIEQLGALMSDFEDLS